MDTTMNCGISSKKKNRLKKCPRLIIIVISIDGCGRSDSARQSTLTKSTGDSQLRIHLSVSLVRTGGKNQLRAGGATLQSGVVLQEENKK